jgi:diguanylate cyclase (GGDEF)-like protein
MVHANPALRLAKKKMASETSAGRAEAERLLASPQFKLLVQGFEKASGLSIHAYNVAGVPETMPFDPPRFCKHLQSGMKCPLYFDPRYHRAARPEIRVTCAGLGHALIPVFDQDGTQMLSLVSRPARFGPLDMDELSQLAFELKVFPDDLVASAEEAPLVPRQRVELAAEILFASLHELSSGEGSRANSLSLLTRHVAGAVAEEVPAAIVAATLDFTAADFGYIVLVDDHGERLAAAGFPELAPSWRDPVANGLAEWAIHAMNTIEVANTAESAWCTHLAGGPLPAAAMVGMPLKSDGKLFGGIVVGAADRNTLPELSTSLAVFIEAGADALLLARRLVASGGGLMVDQRSGAYNLRFLHDLLEKEISRAGRHHHDLSLVLFHTSNYDELLKRVGERAAEQAMAGVVDLMRSRTRKVNSLARVSDTDFCLVVPEADQAIAERIAGDLRTLAQASPISVEQDGRKAQIKLSLQTRTLSNPRGVDAALQSIAPSPN